LAWARLIAMVLACASEICGALLRLVHSAASPIPPTSTTNMMKRMGFRNVTDPAAAACLTVSTFQQRRYRLVAASGLPLATPWRLVVSGRRTAHVEPSGPMGRDCRGTHMDLVAAAGIERSSSADSSASGCLGTVLRLDAISERPTEHDGRQADQRRAPDAGRDVASNRPTRRHPNGDGQTDPSSNTNIDADADADASADADVNPKPNPCANSDCYACANANPDTDSGADPDTNANPSGAAGIQPRLYDCDGERRVDQRHWQQRRPLHQRAGEQLRTGHPVLRRPPPQPAQLPRAKRGEHVRYQQRLHHLLGELEQPRRPDRSQWSELEGLYGGDAVSVLCRRRLPLHAEA